MGWSGGADLMADVIMSAKKVITNKDERCMFYKLIIPSFEGFDCDNLEECKGIDKMFDCSYNQLHKEMKNEDT